VLAVAFVLVVAKQNRWHRIATAPASPADVVYRMLDAARAGKTNVYLECFSGSLKEQLAQTVKESSEERFSGYLVNQNAAFAGVAVSTAERPTDDEVQVRVEYVYKDRSEVQSVYLRRQGSDWKIDKVTSANRIKTLIPYGTVVTD
jgi:hypothetical protein